MPELSIVIPSYNHGAFVSQAVHSVLTQTYRDFELIVVDDGSTDETAVVLSQLDDRRLRVLTQENQGAHAAINRGLGAAGGAYLAILNSDDTFHPQRFEKMVPILRQNPRLGLLASYIEVVDREGRTLGVKHGYGDLEPWLLEHPERSFRATPDLRCALLTENYLATTSNYLFSSGTYRAIGGFLPLRFAHDWDFALRVAREAEIALVPEALIRYRVHGGNTITENQAAMIFEICWILAVHLPRSTTTSWFTALSPAERTDRLLHSIHTFRCETVLETMLAQRLSENPCRAVALLHPDDPERARYLGFITRRLDAEGRPGIAAPDGGIGGRWLRWIAMKGRRLRRAPGVPT